MRKKVKNDKLTELLNHWRSVVYKLLTDSMYDLEDIDEDLAARKIYNNPLYAKKARTHNLHKLSPDLHRNVIRNAVEILYCVNDIVSRYACSLHDMPYIKNIIPTGSDELFQLDECGKDDPYLIPILLKKANPTAFIYEGYSDYKGRWAAEGLIKGLTDDELNTLVDKLGTDYGVQFTGKVSKELLMNGKLPFKIKNLEKQKIIFSIRSDSLINIMLEQKLGNILFI